MLREASPTTRFSESLVTELSVRDHGGWRGGRRTVFPAFVCCLMYAVFAWAVYGFGLLGSGRITGLKWNDSVAQIWWLAWAAHALPDVHNLFLAHGQNYPYGENFGVNASTLLLGVLFAPVTRVFGPIVSFDLLLPLALMSSAASMCFVMRRWTTWWPAAFAAGLLYGFSAYERGFGSELNLIFIPVPPLIMLTLHEMFVRQQWRAWITGTLLGLLCVAQFFIWVEVLAGTLLVGALFVGAMLVATRRELAFRWRYAVTAAGWTAVIGVVLLAYPLLYTFTGPQSINGSPQSRQFLATYNTDLVSSVQNVEHQWFQLFPDISDNVLYLGVPLILLVGCFLLFFRSRREILVAGAMMVASLVLSLGPTLTLSGHSTGIPLPFSVFAHLPAMSGYEARRFALFTNLFGAAIVAIGLDELWSRRHASTWRRTTRVRAAVGVGTVGVLVLGVVLSSVPRSIQSSTPASVPAFFSSPAVNSIPAGGVALTFPYPDLITNSPWGLFASKTINSTMLDQAVSGMRFTLIGGYGWFPSPSGRGGTSSPAQLAPRSVQALFDSAFFDLRPPPGHITPALRTFLRRYDVQAVLVVPPPGTSVHEPTVPTSLAADLTRAIGAPTDCGGVIAWFDIGHSLAAGRGGGCEAVARPPSG
jgi:NADH:ubiquinone oxidoreductase subunit 6 (subunit J)